MQQENRAARSAAEMYDWLQNLIVAFVVGILLFTFVGRVVRVEGSSMYDTLLDKDYVIASNLFYTPKYGDIVVFYNEYDQKSLVKRVIGLPGQTVEVDPETATVYVDGVALEEDYVYSPTTSRRDLTGPVTVPEGCLFCMGDNRIVSRDSRNATVGFVDQRSLVGKVYVLLFPGDDEALGRDFSRMGSVY